MINNRSRLRHYFQLLRSAFVMPAVLITICHTCVEINAQVPQTIQLKPAFAGARFEINLNDLLPSGAAINNWTLVPSGPAPDGAALENPVGIAVENVLNADKSVVGQKLVIAPTAASLVNPDGTLRTEPFVFEVRGSTGGNPVKIRFSLPVKPLNIDESKITAMVDRVDSFTPERPAPLVGAAAAPSFALAKSTSNEETIALMEKVDFDYSNIFDSEYNINEGEGTNLINRTLGKDSSALQVGDYCLIHVIRWKKLNEGKSDPERELWALFKARKDNGGLVWEPQFDPTVEKDDPNYHKIYSSRIFGHKRVAVLALHLNTPGNWDIKYKVSIKQVTPTPIQNLLTLASTIIAAEKVEEEKDVWGGRMMLVRYSSSEMVVQVSTIRSTQTGQKVEQSKEYAKKYFNEGRYFWDVSVGVPVNSFRELQFTSEGNRVTTAAKERQDIYGFLNLYPKPVDLKSEAFLTPPHLVLGVPLGSKPLHRPVIGIGTGIFKAPIKFNIFAGMVFIRERVPRNLNQGETATPAELEADLRTRWVRKFMFGINFPISQIKDALKGDK